MPGNPFDDEEPGSFGSTKSSYQTNTGNSSWLRTDAPVSHGSYSVQSQIYDSQSRAQASQHRALASIANSERIGVDTAAELLEQGEKLSRAEERLDGIEHLQKDSQRQINTLSSWFGGFKGWFSRKQTPTPAATVEPLPSRRSDGNFSGTVQSKTWSEQTYAANSPVSEGTSDFDRNLDMMSNGMSRLKNLAHGMNEELRTQNEQLERMTPRVEKITDTMNRQNQQMNRLLGVKPK